MSGLSKQIYSESKFRRLVDVRDLTAPRAEMKSILRAKTTPPLVRLQLQRAIKLIDSIIESGEPYSKVKRDIEVKTAKKIRNKLKSVRLKPLKRTG